MASKVGARQADYELLEKTILRCPQHKNYKGMLSPIGDCVGCWDVYIASLYAEEKEKRE